MRGVQEKVLAALETAIVGGTPTMKDPNSPWEAVQRSRFANTGLVIAQAKNGFRTALVVDYDFQDERCTLRAWGPAVDQLADLFDLHKPPIRRVEVTDGQSALDGDRRLVWGVLRYTDSERMEDCLKWIREAMVQADGWE